MPKSMSDDSVPTSVEEQRLAALARQLAEAEKLARLGSWEWDIASDRVTWSDQLYEIYGLERGRSIDLGTFLAHVHPEDRESTQERIGQALSRGESFEFHHRIVRPDGVVRRLHARGETILDESGRPARMRGTGQDVTEQFEAEEQARRLVAEHAALEAAEEAGRRTAFLARASAVLASSLDYETTLRSVADLAVPEIADWCSIDLVGGDELRRLVVAHTDPAKVAFASELQRRYPPQRNANQGVDKVVRTGIAEMLEEIPEALIDAAAVDDEHRRILRELGLRSYVCVPLVARGQVLGALSVVYAESGRRYTADSLLLLEDLGRRAGTAIDNARLVSELAEARDRMEEQAAMLEIQSEELRAQNDEMAAQARMLESALRARAEFIATVSHELRTPLNAIMGYTQLIEMGVSGPVAEPVMEHVRRVGVSARQLLQLIDDILTFSSLESDHETTNLEPVRVADLVDEVRAVIEPIARRAGLEFLVDTAAAPESMETDRRKLRQILLNLLGNAVKFTPQGSVRLSVHQHGTGVQFVVADTGIGIPAHEKDRVFEAYWQSSEARARGIGGAGLGLSISGRFARLLGGHLAAESTPGAGSIFTLRLPRRRADQAIEA